MDTGAVARPHTWEGGSDFGCGRAPFCSDLMLYSCGTAFGLSAEAVCGWLVSGSAGQLHRTDCAGFELKQITISIRRELQDDGRELQARRIAGVARKVVGDGSPSPVERLFKFLERIRTKDDTAAEGREMHDKTPFERSRRVATACETVCRIWASFARAKRSTHAPVITGDGTGV